MSARLFLVTLDCMLESAALLCCCLLCWPLLEAVRSGSLPDRIVELLVFYRTPPGMPEVDLLRILIRVALIIPVCMSIAVRTGVVCCSSIPLM